MFGRVDKVALPLAVLFLVLGIAMPLVLHPPEGWRKDLTDLGGIIAGAWALGAGLLTVYAAQSVAEAERKSRRREIAAICLAELQAVWRYLGEHQTLENLREGTIYLRAASESIEQVILHEDKKPLSTYRGHIGSNWLPLQTTSPDVFGALPLDLARHVTEHYSRLRNVLDRLDWMNDQAYIRSDLGGVITRQEEALDELTELDGERGKLMQRLEELAG